LFNLIGVQAEVFVVNNLKSLIFKETPFDLAKRQAQE
jgi:hypothetical protein